MRLEWVLNESASLATINAEVWSEQTV